MQFRISSTTLSMRASLRQEADSRLVPIYGKLENHDLRINRREADVKKPRETLIVAKSEVHAPVLRPAGGPTGFDRDVDPCTGKVQSPAGNRPLRPPQPGGPWHRFSAPGEEGESQCGHMSEPAHGPEGKCVQGSEARSCFPVPEPHFLHRQAQLTDHLEVQASSSHRVKPDEGCPVIMYASTNLAAEQIDRARTAPLFENARRQSATAHEGSR
ncbi:unnamed protein product [Prorocentrum cordatum]|uniref:Cysteine dioxygenase n=1 Tax=Prorocentrum cordatum TaxID=2364126 RepID=A0ABN9SLZ4_9DINO|nr:unnamed protein product [Polarella glacialis]